LILFRENTVRNGATLAQMLLNTFAEMLGLNYQPLPNGFGSVIA
jgi:hypothetical protein